MKFKDIYLPAGIVCAFLLGFLVSTPGQFSQGIELGGVKISHVIIFIIFVISGYQIKLSDISFNQKLGLAVLTGFLINLIGAPVVASSLMNIFSLNEALRIGVFTIACVPPTLTSGIILTEIAKGNTSWAIMFTVVLNISGIFVLPITYDYFIGAGGSTDINPLDILVKLSLLVLLPAIIGFGIKKYKPGVKNLFTQYFQPTGIIFIVYCTVSVGNQQISQLPLKELFLVVTLVISIHLLLFIVCAFSGKILGLTKQQTQALSFVCSQKTLPLSLTLLLIFPTELASQAAIACLLFHLSQIFVDSFIAYKWKSPEDGGQ